MGRRSINTTKSGKYMNPTDQARKEARKRELKKNKKQRMMVRAAVLKGKDPIQLIGDMEKIDEMEFNVDAPPLLNEKVLKDKRKKLKETWDRVMRLYSKEDRERYNELRKLEMEYEARRSILVKYYDSVRIAQQVNVDDIPLPAAPEMPMFLTSQIPLPSEMIGIPIREIVIPPSILKKPVFMEREIVPPKFLKAPGIPPGPIPDLSSEEEDEIDDLDGLDQEENSMSRDTAKSRKIRFADEKGDKDDESDTEKEAVESNAELTEKTNLEDIPIPSAPQPASLPPGPPPLPQGPPPMMFRPPPLGGNIPPPPPRMMPPGMPPLPPGRPTMPPPGMPLRLGAPPIRLPPGPPPGIPQSRMLRPPLQHPPGTAPPITVLSAPPSLMQRPGNMSGDGKATIEAKPQIRNLSADLMRFTPTALRVKREDRKKGSAKGGTGFDQPKDNYSSANQMSDPALSAPTKDDAYLQFLREMEELL